MAANPFYLDRRAGKLMGVCAGIARSTGLDATLVRVLAIVLTLAALHGAGVLLYFLAGLIARDVPRGG